MPVVVCPGGCSRARTAWVVDQRHVGPPMMRAVDGVQRNHHQDQTSRSMFLSFTLSQPVTSPATAPAAMVARMVSQGLVPVESGWRRLRRRGEAAVHREVGKAQQAERDKTPQCHQAEDQADLERRRAGKGTWGGAQVRGKTNRAPQRAPVHHPAAGTENVLDDLRGRLDQRAGRPPCFSRCARVHMQLHLGAGSGRCRRASRPRMRATMRPVCTPGSR